jgi:two-component system, NarL family, sensor histidine kinase EvgS
MALYRQLFIKTFAIVICAMIGFAQNSNGQTLTPEEQAWIAEHPVVRASSNTALAPLDFMSAGKPAGFSIDYLNLVGTKVGLKIDYVNSEVWSEMLKKAINKEIDIVHTISKNEERSKYFNFTAPYINVPIVNFGRVGSQWINSISDLEGKKIGVLKGHVIHNAYQETYPYFNLIEFNTHSEIIRALTLDQIDVYTANSTAIEFLLAQNNIPGIEIIGNDYVLENNVIDDRIAVHKDNPILMAIIKKGVAAITNQELNTISNKWIKNYTDNHTMVLTNEELDWLAENKVIKVSASISSFPFDFVNDEGRLSGVSGDFLNEISKRLNVDFVWAGNENWNDGLLKIHSRDADMITLIAPTKERQSFLEFSEAYLNLESVIFARDDSSVYTNMDALDGRTLVQLKETAIIGYLSENYPNIKIIEAESFKEALELLSSGGADALIENIPGGLANISNFGIKNLRIVGTTPYSEALTFGISSELPLLSSAIQKTLTNIGIEARSVIFTRWLTQRIVPKVDYGPLYYVIGLAVIILIASYIWVGKLRQEVSKRVQAETKANIASQAKSDFLASMSHDLRTPLNAIIGFSETLLQETFGPIKNKKNVEYINDIHSSGEYLLHLVNDILDLSALEADQRELNYESFDGEQLTLECKNIVFKLADDKNIDIAINNTEKLPNVYADKKAVKQILMNLITNSIKFTPPNGNITISYNVSDDNYFFQISDTGWGISEEAIKIIDRPFTRAEPSALISHEEGTGLGLSIVKSLVDVHGGELNIESIVGEGTTVTISLPLQNTAKLS